jgi:hypothetical protein
MSSYLQIITAVSYAVLTVIPLVILKIHVKTGRNAVEAQKWRVKNKAFSKAFSGSAFMILAAFVLAYWVM